MVLQPTVHEGRLEALTVRTKPPAEPALTSTTPRESALVGAANRWLNSGWLVGKGLATQCSSSSSQLGTGSTDGAGALPDALDPMGPCQAGLPPRGSKSRPERHTPHTMLSALRMQWPSAFIGLLPACRLRR